MNTKINNGVTIIYLYIYIFISFSQINSLNFLLFKYLIIIKTLLIYININKDKYIMKYF